MDLDKKFEEVMKNVMERYKEALKKLADDEDYLCFFEGCDCGKKKGTPLEEYPDNDD